MALPLPGGVGQVSENCRKGRRCCRSADRRSACRGPRMRTPRPHAGTVCGPSRVTPAHCQPERPFSHGRGPHPGGAGELVVAQRLRRGAMPEWGSLTQTSGGRVAGVRKPSACWPLQPHWVRAIGPRHAEGLRTPACGAGGGGQRGAGPRVWAWLLVRCPMPASHPAGVRCGHRAVSFGRRRRPATCSLPGSYIPPPGILAAGYRDCCGE